MNKEAIEMFEAIRENEIERANALFESSLQKSAQTKNIEELAEFAEELHQSGFLSEARDALLLLKELAPQLKDWDLALAEIAIDEDRHEEALDILLHVEESDPLYPQALVLLADAYQTMGLYEISEQKLMEAIKLLPDEPVLVFALARLYHSSGEYRKAIPLYEQLSRKAEEQNWWENVDLLLADCYSAEGRFEEAVSLLDQVPEEELTSDSLFQRGLAQLQLHEAGRAAQTLSGLLEKDPDYESAYLYLAMAFEENEDVASALEAAQAGIGINPYQPEFYLMAAKLHLRRSEKQEAKAKLMELRKLDPDHSEGTILLTDLLLEEGKAEEVVELLGMQAQEGAAEPIYHWQLAQAYDKLEEYESAGKEYEAAYAALQDSLPFLEDYSTYLLEEGNFFRLREVTKHALLLEPHNAYFRELWEDRLNGDL